MHYSIKNIIIIVIVLGFHLGLKAQNLFTENNFPSFVNQKWNTLIIQDSSALLHFNKKLQLLDIHQKGKINVAHIGDSHVQAGFFTQGLRNTFHPILGCGINERGFIFPFALTQNTGPLNVVQKFNGSWVTEKQSSNNIGVNAIATSTSDSAQLKIYFKNLNGFELSFDSIVVFGHWDTSIYNCWIHGNMDTLNQLAIPYQKIKFKSLNDTLYIKIQLKNNFNNNPNIRFQINGIYIGNNIPSLTFSEIGLNGGKISDFLNAPSFLKELKLLKPDLVILSLGTNDLYKENFTVLNFYNQYDSLINLVKKSSPFTSIILTTPPDFKKINRTQIYNIQEVRKVLIALGKKHNCAVWDLFSIMGGVNSIQTWADSNLVANDKIHFKPKAYKIHGELLANSIIKQYNTYSFTVKKKSLIIDTGYLWWDTIQSILIYSQNNPWTFSSWEFWIIFGFLYFIYSLIYKKNNLKILYLLIFSIFFYYKSSQWYIAILAFSTITDYYLGKKIYTSSKNTSKKIYLFSSIFINLLVLGFFKYSQFVVQQINLIFNVEFKVVNFLNLSLNELFSLDLNIHEIILPAGISFFTFQTMSYAIDIYNNKIKPTDNIIDFGFYVSFFPQLVAGPIVRAQEFIPQINQKFNLNKHQLAQAFFLIYSGLIKKIIISNFLAHHIVDNVFAQPQSYSGIENLLAIYGYSIQIYCDFSAYSDIAIAIALLLGYQLPSNFNNPYTAKSISDFWNKWHQSLSRWLKDYIYIPMGGNRKGKIRQFINLLVTMLIGGFWHGASLKFIFWGGFHGFALIADKIYQKWSYNWKFKNYTIIKFISIIFTFHLVSFAWIFFRANTFNDGLQLLYQIKNHFIPSVQFLTAFLFNYNWVIFWICTVFIGQFLFDYIHDFSMKILFKSSWWVLTIITAVLVFILFQFSSIPNQPFIYFYF